VTKARICGRGGDRVGRSWPRVLSSGGNGRLSNDDGGAVGVDGLGGFRASFTLAGAMRSVITTCRTWRS
jgi:hypothetical protein